MNQPPKRDFSAYSGPLFAAGVAIILLALAWLFLFPKSYTAASRIKVADWSRDSNPVNPSDTGFIAAECKLLRSTAVMDDAITNLGLMELWGKQSSPPRPFTLDEARAQLARRVFIRQIPGRSVVEIRVTSPVRSEPAAIANELARDYFARRLEHHRAVIHFELDTLEKDYQEKNEDVLLAQSNVDFLAQAITFKRATNQVKYYEPEAYEMLVHKKIDLESQYIQQQDELAGLHTLPAGDLKQSLSITESNSTLIPLLMQLSDSRRKLFAAKLDNGPDSPEVTRAAALVQELDRKSDELAATILKARDTRLAALKASLDNMTSRLRYASTNTAAALAGDTNYNAALAALKKSKEVREDAQYKIDVVHMSEKLIPDGEKLTTEIIDKAEAPVSPASPDQNVGMGAITFGAFLIFTGFIARVSKPKNPPAAPKFK
jgi:uncharacterized protein involved in exopolysaccharide biosynthesis